MEVVQPAPVEHDDGVAVGARGEGQEFADEQGALDPTFLPVLGERGESVDDDVGGDGEDGGEERFVALNDGEVELSVCA